MSRAYMVNTHPFIHVHTDIRVDGFGPSIWGWCTALPPHGEDFDFETDGLTAEDGLHCVAYDEVNADKCGMPAVAVFACTTIWEKHYGRFHLCGVHYQQHRGGQQVRLAI